MRSSLRDEIAASTVVTQSMPLSAMFWRNRPIGCGSGSNTTTLPVLPTRLAMTSECMPTFAPMSIATCPGRSIRLISFDTSGRKAP